MVQTEQHLVIIGRYPNAKNKRRSLIRETSLYLIYIFLPVKNNGATKNVTITKAVASSVIAAVTRPPKINAVAYILSFQFLRVTRPSLASLFSVLVIRHFPFRKYVFLIIWGVYDADKNKRRGVVTPHTSFHTMPASSFDWLDSVLQTIHY